LLTAGDSCDSCLQTVPSRFRVVSSGFALSSVVTTLRAEYYACFILNDLLSYSRHQDYSKVSEQLDLVGSFICSTFSSPVCACRRT